MVGYSFYLVHRDLRIVTPSFISALSGDKLPLAHSLWFEKRNFADIGLVKFIHRVFEILKCIFCNMDVNFGSF